MRGSTAVFYFSLTLALCALSFVAGNFCRTSAPTPPSPPPAQQEMTPVVALPPAAAAVASSASTPAPTTAREAVHPTVTLKEQRISIQTAATQVCGQAGVQYDWKRSQEKAGSNCRRLIAVNLENATLEEALAQIVLKNGLRYRMEGQSLWLEMPE